MTEADDPAGAVPPATKLTLTKQKWAEQHKFLTGRAARPETERLPPGQHLVKDWPVLDLGIQPNLPPFRWSLDVDGLVARPVHWTWDAFGTLPQTRAVTDIHCVTTWSRYDNTWDGVATRDLLALVEPTDAARFVVLHSFDGYTTNLPLADFAAPDALLAHSWEGAPLTREHGGPVRLVVPHLYFWKSAKWLKRIEFVAEDALGFWEVRGYHERGDPWKEERYSDD
ncbi:sulfite oxidase-like oxidoreductase [Aquabacter spiritensis]|uniref:DMSO/TMAO reductase YedYZ molybdopterin-dependent catalytic subunit n=1 Tax=Aquabacter spiritensis TaxID=933073 RepID=A0A4R3M3B4_9HYPH|nr:sulfite oxidase-like oxidoreductase [Aquabacter spiritensis]TCT07721.1 DMSO/TMAO reductase YedYZ molybdopterin-dependent catalytic subunit [Aquabacter spiritensis]